MSSTDAVPPEPADEDVGITEPPDFDRVYARLREAILTGELVPDSRMSQVALAKELRISRSPLREALRMLQREGLIQADPGRRGRVAAITAPDLEQLYSMRIVLEVMALRLTVPTMDEAVIDALERHLREMETLVGEGRFDDWEAPHRGFHERLVAGGGERVIAELRQLSDHAERYRRILLRQPRAWSLAAEEHHAIVDACRVGDAATASRHLASHLAKTALTVSAVLDPGYEPAAVREALAFVNAASTPERSSDG